MNDLILISAVAVPWLMKHETETIESIYDVFSDFKCFVLFCFFEVVIWIWEHFLREFKTSKDSG